MASRGDRLIRNEFSNYVCRRVQKTIMLAGLHFIRRLWDRWIDCQHRYIGYCCGSPSSAHLVGEGGCHSRELRGELRTLAFSRISRSPWNAHSAASQIQRGRRGG